MVVVDGSVVVVLLEVVELAGRVVEVAGNDVEVGSVVVVSADLGAFDPEMETTTPMMTPMMTIAAAASAIGRRRRRERERACAPCDLEDPPPGRCATSADATAGVA